MENPDTEVSLTGQVISYPEIWKMSSSKRVTDHSQRYLVDALLYMFEPPTYNIFFHWVK